MIEEQNIAMGTRLDWGYEIGFELSQADRRQHIYAVGKSGTGKSTLLFNLIMQDIEAGRGVALIDPHGDLAEEVLQHIPRRRTEDVVWFDPSDAEHPVGLNLVGGVPRERRHLVASGIVSALRGIWPDSWGPRLEYILYAAVAAVLECECATLLGVQRMLSDARYRAWVVRQVKDPAVRSFWEDEFERYERRFMQEAVAPIQIKLGQVLMSPHLRNILGQVRGRIDFRRMMDGGKIFVASLSKGRIGADKAGLLGSLLVTQFHLAAMSRADVPERERRDFFLYVDEFQSFASDSFASMLSEARKYRLCLSLSHQYMAQLRPGVLDAVLGNVGSIMAFRVGHQDAEPLRAALGGACSADDLVSLGNGEVFAKTLSGGRDVQAFRGRTLMPSATRHGRMDTIVRRSRERFARGRAVVEGKIERWMGRR